MAFDNNTPHSLGMKALQGPYVDAERLVAMHSLMHEIAAKMVANPDSVVTQKDLDFAMNICGRIMGDIFEEPDVTTAAICTLLTFLNNCISNASNGAITAKCVAQTLLASANFAEDVATTHILRGKL